MSEAAKPVLLSAIQPSGNLMIGNYIGAIRNWVDRLDDYDCRFVLVDMHAITVKQDPADLLRRCYGFLALYIASGLDPARSTIFVQSHVPAHAQLSWLLNCFTYTGELNRMTQWKDKAQRQGGNAAVGLFAYPVLMAADILLHNTSLVPVGADQKQHLELTRDIAQRFNGMYGDIFTVPELYIPKLGARIMSLQDPTAKMSKSDPDPDAYVALLDPPDVVRKKIRGAVTDSGREIEFNEQAKPAISNLISIYAAITAKSFDEIAREFAGQGYGAFKDVLSDVVIAVLRPIQQKYEEIYRDETLLNSVLERGAQHARDQTKQLLSRVHEVIGFIPQAESLR